MQEYGPEADEWSVGMLMYQLLTGNLPFWNTVQNVSLQQVSAATCFGLQADGHALHCHLCKASGTSIS